MLLTISTTHRPATDLGFLLHKNPGRHHLAEFGFGTAHVFYPEASDERCSAAVLVDVDPVALVRGPGTGRERAPAGRFALGDYVNDRPYVASSYLSVALGRLFGTAMSGRSKERQDVADQVIPLEARLPVVACRGGADLARRLFEPLGYATWTRPLPLDPQFPGWGDSPYLALRISARLRLRDLLHHLFVLLPVLDDDKHYWVGADEVAKLLRRGGEWLAGHPERDLIARRYLRHDQRLTRDGSRCGTTAGRTTVRSTSSGTSTDASPSWPRSWMSWATRWTPKSARRGTPRAGRPCSSATWWTGGRPRPRCCGW